jgi:hypothetical protein
MLPLLKKLLITEDSVEKDFEDRKATLPEIGSGISELTESIFSSSSFMFVPMSRTLNMTYWDFTSCSLDDNVLRIPRIVCCSSSLRTC